MTLPAATPPAKIKLLSSFGPRSATTQAVLMLFQKSPPGTSGIGTWLTSRRFCDEAITMMTKGPIASRKPMNRITCVARLRKGVRSTIVASVVVNAPLDEAELKDGEDD